VKLELLTDPSDLEGPAVPPGQEKVALPKQFVAAMHVAVIPLFLLFYLLFPDAFHQFDSELDWASSLLILPVLLAIILAHELVHLALSPGSLFHPSARILIVPKHLAVYAYTAVPMSRNQALWMSLAPFTILTCGVLMFHACFLELPAWVRMAAIANGVMSAGDLFIAAALLKVPSSGRSISVNATGIYFTRLPTHLRVGD
jgi:hypothetical protein